MDISTQNSFLKMSIDIFLLMDVIGVIPIILLLLRQIALPRQKQIIIREMVIALGVMLIAQFFGRYILSFLHISQAALYLSGFVVLFLTALSILLPSPSSATITTVVEPFIVPIAIPLVAGSGVLARVMIFADQQSFWPIVTLAILLAWLVSTAILFFLPQISRFLGQTGVAACERLMGLLVLILAVDSLLAGIRAFIQIR